MKHIPYIFAKVKADELGGFIEKNVCGKNFTKNFLILLIIVRRIILPML